MSDSRGAVIQSAPTRNIRPPPLMEILTIWQPYYWLSALVKVITAIASVITAILLVRLVPAALKIPSPQQLAKVNDELREAQAELVTTARRAGMAEVATNVLHNVGNVLNSVNVSAQVLCDKVHTSKGPAVAKVAQLMKEHPDDLGDFISSDPKARALPDYLDKLADALAVEQQGMIAELAQLTTSRKSSPPSSPTPAMPVSWSRARCESCSRMSCAFAMCPWLATTSR